MTKKKVAQIALVLKKKGLIATPMQLANVCALLEDGKSEANIGDIRQVVKIICDLCAYQDEGYGTVFGESFNFVKKVK